MSTRTITGDRPEVVAAVKERIQLPIGAVAPRIIPVVKKADKTGTIYYKQLVSDAAPVTRSDEVANWARTRIAAASTSFSCVERGKVYTIAEGDVKSFGGIEATDRIGVTAACRSLLREYEAAVAGTLIDSTSAASGVELVEDNAAAGIIEASLEVGRYFGKTALIASAYWYQQFAALKGVRESLLAMVQGNVNALMAVSRDPQAVVNLLKLFIGIDEILIGDDAAWKVSGYEDCAIVAKIPPANFADDAEEMELIMRENPVIGVAPWLLPDETDRDVLFVARSFFDENNDTNNYKAKGFYDLKLLNAGASQVVTLPQAPAVVTTS